jgi:ABC-type phosphate/phosphonate transport system ATPase subunit
MQKVAVFGNTGGGKSTLARRVAELTERFAAADTLIHADLPLLTHCRWVTKRLVKGMLVTPGAGRTIARSGAAR